MKCDKFTSKGIHLLVGPFLAEMGCRRRMLLLRKLGWRDGDDVRSHGVVLPLRGFMCHLQGSTG